MLPVAEPSSTLLCGQEPWSDEPEMERSIHFFVGANRTVSFSADFFVVRNTAAVARGLKKQLYPDRFRTPESFWFASDTQELVGWRLGADGVYAEAEALAVRRRALGYEP